MECEHQHLRCHSDCRASSPAKARGARKRKKPSSLEMRILPLLLFRIIPSAIPPPLYYGMLIPHLECCTLVHLELAGRPSTRRQILADPQFSKNIRRHVEPRCVRAQVVKVGVRIITRARALKCVHGLRWPPQQESVSEKTCRAAVALLRRGSRSMRAPMEGARGRRGGLP